MFYAYESKTLYISVWFETEQEAADFDVYPVSCLDGDRVVIAPILSPGAARSVYDHLKSYPGIIDVECP